MSSASSIQHRRLLLLIKTKRVPCPFIRGLRVRQVLHRTQRTHRQKQRVPVHPRLRLRTVYPYEIRTVHQTDVHIVNSNDVRAPCTQMTYTACTQMKYAPCTHMMSLAPELATTTSENVLFASSYPYQLSLQTSSIRATKFEKTSFLLVLANGLNTTFRVCA